MPFSRIKAGLLAGVAMLVLVPSAQAQFSASSYAIISSGSDIFVDVVGGTPSIYDVSGTASISSFTATANSLSLTGMIDGYTLSVSGSFNAGATSGPGLLAYTTSLTPGGGAVGDFFTIYTLAGDYTTPVGSPLTYTNTQTASGLNNSTNLAAFVGVLNADYVNTYYANPVGSLQGGDTTAQSVTVGSFYDLYQYGAIQTDGTGPVSQTMTSIVTPEPNSVLLGLLGLPCMGIVVYFARRRSSTLTAEVA